MGMLDQEVMFADGQTVTAIGDTASTNAYNTGGANGQNEAAMTGENLWINAVVKTTATSGGAATIQAVFQDSPDNATWTDRVLGAVTPVATAVAGSPLLQVQPPVGTQQYWRVVTRVAAFVLTAGTFDAYVSNTLQRNISRPSGFAVV